MVKARIYALTLAKSSFLLKHISGRVCPPTQIPSDQCDANFCRPSTSLCHNQLRHASNAHCISGGADCCTCAQGSYFDGARCVPADECPCVDDEGIVRAPAEEFYATSDSAQCVLRICVNNEIEVLRNVTADCACIISCPEVSKNKEPNCTTHPAVALVNTPPVKLREILGFTGRYKSQYCTLLYLHSIYSGLVLF